MPAAVGVSRMRSDDRPGHVPGPSRPGVRTPSAMLPPSKLAAQWRAGQAVAAWNGPRACAWADRARV